MAGFSANNPIEIMKGNKIPINIFDAKYEKTDLLQDLKRQIDLELEIRLIYILSKCLMKEYKNPTTRIFPISLFFEKLDSKELIFLRDSDCQFSKLAEVELTERDKHLVRNMKGE